MQDTKPSGAIGTQRQPLCRTRTPLLGFVIAVVSVSVTLAQATLAQPALAQGTLPQPALPQPALPQQGTPPAPPDGGAGWQFGTQIERQAPAKPTPPRAAPTPASPFNTTVVPRTPAEPRPAAAPTVAELQLEAFLTDDGQRIEQGVAWHVFQEPATGLETPGAKPQAAGSFKEARPALKLAPGNYIVTLTFGRAHLTRKLALRAGPNPPERFVLNAGGLRVAALLASGDPVPEVTFGYDIFAGDPDQTGGRNKVMGDAKPGLIIRLNAGIYRIVSTYGDANSIVRADVTVEAGKLTEATITHLAAKVTFKLVSKAGGDALADTHWTIQTAQGEKVREGPGALPSHTLAAGTYEVIAKHGDKAYKRGFSIDAGDPVQVEIVISPGR